MSPSTALRPREDSPARFPSFVSHELVAIVVAAVLVLAITQWSVAGPSRVQMTIVNETDYALTVAARGRDGGGWTSVLVVEPGQTRPDRVTIDHGDEWVFQFSGQGRSGVELRLTREQLADNDWNLVVPRSVAEQLERQGATPPQRSR